MAFDHVAINGLSIGGGGGYTVGRDLLIHLAQARPSTRFVLHLIQGKPLHEEMRAVALPDNAALAWAPAGCVSRTTRDHFERSDFCASLQKESVNALLQLNGMTIPGCKTPALAFCQDPWPYRPQAWAGLKDRGLAYLKRRRQAASLKHAACVGWTSAYLRDEISAGIGYNPEPNEVFHNGVPQA